MFHFALTRCFVWLLLPALAVTGLPAELCACVVASDAPACCAMDLKATDAKCCCENSTVPCGCCPKEQSPNQTPGECDCSIQSAAPAVPADSAAPVTLDLSPSWNVQSFVVFPAGPVLTRPAWAFDLPPPDLVIELRNLRI